MLNIQCLECNKKISLPDNYVGKTVTCSQCKNTFTVEDAHLQAENTETEPFVKNPKSTKACPYCGEEILEVAKKCKHCGEFMDISKRAISMASNVVKKGRDSRSKLVLVAILAASFLVGFSFLFFFVQYFNYDNNKAITKRMNNTVIDKEVSTAKQADDTDKNDIFVEHANNTSGIKGGEIIEQPNDVVENISEIERQYLLTLKPFADELQSMQNEWDIGMVYRSYGGAILRLKNAYDRRGKSPPDVHEINMMLKYSDSAIWFHMKAYEIWGQSIESIRMGLNSISQEGKSLAEETAGQALEYGRKFLDSYETTTKNNK